MLMLISRVSFIFTHLFCIRKTKTNVTKALIPDMSPDFQRWFSESWKSVSIKMPRWWHSLDQTSFILQLPRWGKIQIRLCDCPVSCLFLCCSCHHICPGSYEEHESQSLNLSSIYLFFSVQPNESQEEKFNPQKKKKIKTAHSLILTQQTTCCYTKILYDTWIKLHHNKKQLP